MVVLGAMGGATGESSGVSDMSDAGSVHGVWSHPQGWGMVWEV